jgi:hypothetical protein
LTTTPSCPAASAAAGEGLEAVERPRHPPPLRDDPCQRGGPLVQRRAEQVLAVEVEDVEEPRREPDRAVGTAADERWPRARP